MPGRQQWNGDFDATLVTKGAGRTGSVVSHGGVSVVAASARLRLVQA